MSNFSIAHSQRPIPAPMQTGRALAGTAVCAEGGSRPSIDINWWNTNQYEPEHENINAYDHDDQWRPEGIRMYDTSLAVWMVRNDGSSLFSFASFAGAAAGWVLVGVVSAG